MVHELSNMSWMEAEEKFKKTKLALVPVGAVEQHGMHLGVGADWIQAWNIAEKVGEKTDALVLPVMPYGVSGHHRDFVGTVFLKPETLQKVISEILECLNRYGIEKVVFINGHGGNLQAISEAAKEARVQYGMVCAIIQWWDALVNKPVLGQPAETHGGYAETSLMLASRPQAVKMQYAMLSPTKQVDKDIQLISSGTARFKDGVVRVILRTADVSQTGSMTEHHPDQIAGTTDYSKVTKEFAEKLMKEVVEYVCDFIRKFETFELPPISVSKDAALKALKK
jgi:creatinine amidohydrolase